MTILLVDSDKKALDREAKRFAGRQSGVMAVLHSSAADALRFAMYHDVDLVYTRSVLAEMTGQELIDKIHCFKPKAQCHILLKDEPIPLSSLPEENQPCQGGKIYTPAPKSESRVPDTKQARENSPPTTYENQEGQQRGGKLMMEKDLRSLGRKELLELMIEQGKELEFVKSEHEKDLEFLKEEHQKELEEVRAELEQAKQALHSREIAINEAGSIAVAALQINGIFEAAQAASQQYIENIRSLNERQASICAQRDADSRAESERRLQETTQKCQEMEAACREKCVAMEADAKQRSQAYWTEVSKRLQAFYENHQELKKLLNFSVPNIPNIPGIPR